MLGFSIYQSVLKLWPHDLFMPFLKADIINHAMSAHKIVAEALEHLRFEAYFNYLDESRKKYVNLRSYCFLFFHQKASWMYLRGLADCHILMTPKNFVNTNHAILSRLLYGTRTLLCLNFAGFHELH